MYRVYYAVQAGSKALSNHISEKPPKKSTCMLKLRIGGKKQSVAIGKEGHHVNETKLWSPAISGNGSI